MKNLIIRTVTGVLFVAVLIVAIVASQFSFGLLFALISGLATWEFCSIVNKREDVMVNSSICTLASVSMYLGSYAWFVMPGLNIVAFIPYLFTIMYLLVSSLYFDRTYTLTSWAYTMMSQMYVALPFALLNALSFVPYSDFGTQIGYKYIWLLPMSVFIFLWCSDTGAYCVGSLLGKKIPYRLFPSISPNKSWVGSIGGGILDIIAAVILSLVDTAHLLTMPQWIGLGIVVCIFGTWGDLVESQIKRQLGIKDSGNILPGHGGILDRFDSTLLAIPAALVYIYMIWMM